MKGRGLSRDCSIHFVGGIRVIPFFLPAFLSCFLDKTCRRDGVIVETTTNASVLAIRRREAVVKAFAEK